MTLKGSQGLSRALKGSQKLSSNDLKGSQGFSSRVLKGSQRISRHFMISKSLMGFNGLPWTFMGSHGLPLYSMDSQGLQRDIKGSLGASNRSSNAQYSMFVCSKPKIGCSDLITEIWVHLSLFDEWFSKYQWYKSFNDQKLNSCKWTTLEKI